MFYAENHYMHTCKTVCYKLHINSEIYHIHEFYTHIITFLGLIITYGSCEIVTGTVTELTQTERTGGVVDDHVTRPAGSITNSILWTGAATHTVGMA